jgi:hypothetical protein
VSAFLEELRSRSIYRIAGGYVVSAWLILQVASTVSAALSLPSWPLKVVLAVLLLGFGVALVIGWRLDRHHAHEQKPSVKLHFVMWPAVALFVTGGMILIIFAVIDANRPADSQGSEQADRGKAVASGSAALTPVTPIVDLLGGIQLVVKEQQTFLNDKELGLHDMAGKGVAVIENGPTHLQFLFQVVNDTYLVNGTDFKHLTSAGKVLGPGEPGEFDNAGAGVGTIIRFNGKLYGFYEGRDREGDLPANEQGGFKGVYCSIGLG